MMVALITVWPFKLLWCLCITVFLGQTLEGAILHGLIMVRPKCGKNGHKEGTVLSVVIIRELRGRGETTTKSV